MTPMMMYDADVAELPDRQALTGAPIENQCYRDGARTDVVFKWTRSHLGREHAEWLEIPRIKPIPPRTARDLREAGFTFVSHQQMATGGYVYVYANQADPRLFVRVAREHGAADQCVTLVVGAKGFDLDDWDAAATALAALEGGDDA